MNGAKLSSAPKLSADSPSLEPVGTLFSRLPSKRIAPNTQWRWIHRGVNGIRLPALHIGGKWYSTQAAVNWFFEAK